MHSVWLCNNYVQARLVITIWQTRYLKARLKQNVFTKAAFNAKGLSGSCL